MLILATLVAAALGGAEASAPQWAMPSTIGDSVIGQFLPIADEPRQRQRPGLAIAGGVIGGVGLATAGAGAAMLTVGLTGSCDDIPQVEYGKRTACHDSLRTNGVVGLVGIAVAAIGLGAIITGAILLSAGLSGDAAEEVATRIADDGSLIVARWP